MTTKPFATAKPFAAVTAAAITAGLLAAVPASAAAADPAAAAAKPATQPTGLADASGAAGDRLTGTALAIRAQQAFNRGEYAAALPLLKKLEAESTADKVGPIQERIRVSEKALASAKAEAEAKAAKGLDPRAPAATPTADVSGEARKPHQVPPAGQVLDTTIQGLGNFEYDQDKGGNVPEDVTKLTGSTVRLRGYMIPMDQADNITQFALVPSLFACCFGQPPAIQHTIVVSCPKGKAVPYTADEISVQGTLKVQEKKDDGYIVSLFEMETQSVKLAPKSE